jgi:hypothetical protein
VASLRLLHRRRGRELLNLTNIDFQKPAIAKSIAGFLLQTDWRSTPNQNRKKCMNINYKRVPAEFGPETRFEVKPVPPAPFRALQENQFEQLKEALLTDRLKHLWRPDLSAHVRRAANEAAALAWVTPYPLLVFPVLFDEKAAGALVTAGRQQEIRRRTRELFVV